MSVSVTQSYARAHRAFAAAASGYGFTGFAVRVLVALYEHGSLTQDEVAVLLHVDAACVRRSGLALARDGMVEREGLAGGPVKPGTPAVLLLTMRGARVARAALRGARPAEAAG